MATITTDTFLDGGTARTAGEAWTCNGGRLTIRTDSRWHADAPASMTGSLGAVTISSSLGGGYTIDGTKVRWLAYNTGTGNVPAIGTTITQGGVSGYLLGVWSSLTSAPTAVAAAMPTTGFIKFREVTGGTFAAGALTGIGASATGADVVGWIEVVHDQSIAITVPRLGDFTVRGDWFDLGTTTGAADQLVQVPTNGSSTCYVPGVYIETSVAGTYEFVPSIYAAGMTTTNLGTDIRSKFVCMETTGAIRIGHNGTGAVGYVWPAGRKIRIPNVFGRQCTTAARATNAIPHATLGTRPDFATTSGGKIDIQNFASDWYLSFTMAYKVDVYDSCSFDNLSAITCPTDVAFVRGGNGISQSLSSTSLSIGNVAGSGLVQDWVCSRFSAVASGDALSCTSSYNVLFERIKAGIVTYARNTGQAVKFSQSVGCVLKDSFVFNAGVTLTTVFDCEVLNLDYCSRYVGQSTATEVTPVSIDTSSSGVLIEGMTFGLGGQITNVHPAGVPVISANTSRNIKVRNFGSRGSFLSCGTLNYPMYIFSSVGNCRNVELKRLYVAPTATAALYLRNTDYGVIAEHVYGTFANSQVVVANNCVVKNCGATPGTAGQSSVYGSHFGDMFVSDTAGRQFLVFNEPTVSTLAYVTTVSGTPRFTAAGNVSMQSVGDELILEQSYFSKGHTGFSSTAPTVTGTNVTYSSGARWGNHDIYYQVDTGSGWNGSWKNLTGANLATEICDPATGFKLKIRVVCATANTGNLLTQISIVTTSTLAAQTNNLYPLDVNSLTITGLPTGCDAFVLSAGTNTVLDQRDSIGATSYTYTYSGAQNVDVGIIKPGYIPYYIRNLSLTTADSSIPVALTPDRNYA